MVTIITETTVRYGEYIPSSPIGNALSLLTIFV